MFALFGLSVLAGTIAILALLGIAAARFGVDSRPGFRNASDCPTSHFVSHRN